MPAVLALLLPRGLECTVHASPLIEVISAYAVLFHRHWQGQEYESVWKCPNWFVQVDSVKPLNAHQQAQESAPDVTHSFLSPGREAALLITDGYLNKQLR